METAFGISFGYLSFRYEMTTRIEIELAFA